MSRYHSYLNSAREILLAYKGEEPFASFSKKYFATNKKYGSTDRKQISHLCYCYFRLGKALQDLPVEERILTGLFLCTNSPNEILQELKPEWNEKTGLTLEEKFSLLPGKPSMFPVFPWNDELSEGIDFADLNRSFFIQPDLFLRLRPGKEEIAEQKLARANIRFAKLPENCIVLLNTTKIDTVIELDKEAVVQDLNSQRISKFFSVRRGPSDGGSPSDRVWDCCAGSGGKSIILYDMQPEMELTVSDTRESILLNLEKRFKTAGVKHYKEVRADLSKPTAALQLSTFNFIIADIPCTGSGAWGRTPEQLFYFDKKKIAEYATVQQQIISTVIPYLQNAGHLLYITCSVFRKENEEIVDFIRENFHLELEKMEMLKGYHEKADTLFAALLKKTS